MSVHIRSCEVEITFTSYSIPLVPSLCCDNRPLDRRKDKNTLHNSHSSLYSWVEIVEPGPGYKGDHGCQNP